MTNRKKKLAAVLAATLMVGFGIGYTTVAAYAIPGWDRPWDPPNYYSLDSISWADTANPSFFFRDLGWQGGNVYDHQRDIQSGYEKQNILNWLEQQIKRYALQLINSTPLDAQVLIKGMTGIENAQEATQDLNQRDTASKILEGTVMRDFNRYDSETNPYSVPQKTKVMQDAYTKYADVAQTALVERKNVDGTIAALLDASQGVEGDMQIEQIRGQMMGLEEVAKARRNALLANLLELRAIQQKAKTDDDIAYFEQVEKAKLIVRDPYHQTERQKDEYQRPEGRGFVPF